MPTTTRPTKRWTLTRAPVPAGNGGPPGAVRGRRLAPVTVGFWVGGVFLGTVGCLLGASLPYHRPVTLVVSALWWGIYLGALGASLGALACLCLGRKRPTPGAGAEGAGQPPSRTSGPWRRHEPGF
jgi:hypothetical protein